MKERTLTFAIIQLLIVYISFTLSCDHGHAHGAHNHHHHHEEEAEINPSFKYSREANVKFQKQEASHGHSHGGHHVHEEHEHKPDPKPSVAKPQLGKKMPKQKNIIDITVKFYFQMNLTSGCTLCLRRC